MSGGRRAAVWWILAAIWLLGAGVTWAVYLRERAETERAAARQRAWMKQVQQTQAIKPAEHRPEEPKLKALTERLLADVQALAFERYTDEARARARGHIAHSLTRLGDLPALHAFSGGVNVLVERPGTDARAAAVLLGAHFDTVKGSPGADDNASGVAVVLEVARLLSGRKFRRPLRLAFFDLEEQGLLGSARYAASEERLDGLDSVVIVEMAGYCDRRKGSQRVPPGLPAGLAPDVGDFIAAVADLEHAALLAPFRRAAGADRPPVYALPVPEKGRALPDTRRSDHSPFWDRGVGAVLITDTAELRSPHYHQPSDTPETLDPVFLTGVATVVAEAVAELLDAPPATPPPASPGSSQ